MTRNLLRRGSRAFAELVFPPRCAACGSIGAGVCAECLSQIVPLPEPSCRTCSRPLEFGDQCATCRADGRRIDRVYVKYPYETPLREAVHRLKYGNRRYLARDLAAIAVTALPDDLTIDAVVPIPLHPRREAQRGYNQSVLLARAVAERTGQPIEPDRLTRTRDTWPQTSLPRRQRLLNVRGALRATRSAAGLRLLLVDDVTTTGATLDAAASALKRRGAVWVGALVMARQPLTPPQTLG